MSVTGLNEGRAVGRLLDATHRTFSKAQGENGPIGMITLPPH